MCFIITNKQYASNMYANKQLISCENWSLI